VRAFEVTSFTGPASQPRCSANMSEVERENLGYALDEAQFYLEALSIVPDHPNQKRIAL